ncbi:MAG: hypothetical protein ACOC2Y_05375 [Spirochaetota bacterium]
MAYQSPGSHRFFGRSTLGEGTLPAISVNLFDPTMGLFQGSYEFEVANEIRLQIVPFYQSIKPSVIGGESANACGVMTRLGAVLGHRGTEWAP